VAFKRLVGYASVGIVIELEGNLPDWETYLKRWTSEKVYGMILDHGIFLSNAKGYNVLSKNH
jgi:hypothetical protein